MILYPTMELKNGRCVSLVRGDLQKPELWHVDPVATARSWAAAGALWMQVTDFDAIEDRDANRDLVREIIRGAGIPVQLAGGLSADAIARWIDMGVGRVVVSTLAARDPEGVKALARTYPDQVVLSVDVAGGRLMIDGWREPAAIQPEDFIRAFNAAPLAGVVVTDIDSDLGDTEAQMGVISNLAAHATAPVIASGVVRSLDDVSRLKYVPNISGAIVGRALFRRSFDLSEALALARPEPEATADFH